MDLTASVLADMLTKTSIAQPHTFFHRFDNVVWLDFLERLVTLQHLHKFDRTKAWAQARVRRGTLFWQLLTNAAQLQPKAVLFLPSTLRPHVPPAPLHVVGVRHTPFRVSMTAFLDAASGTLAVALTGLRSRNVGVGIAVTCHTALAPFGDVCERLIQRRPHADKELQQAKVHAGIASLLPHFVHSRCWRAIVDAVVHPCVKHVVFVGFSLGGSFAHLLSQMLRVQVLSRMPHFKSPPPLLVMTVGAPRTGDAVWAHTFARRTPHFAALNLVAAGRVAGMPGTIEADEVPTMPLHATGFHTCMPLVAVVDGQHVQPHNVDRSTVPPPVAVSTPELATKDLWGLKTRLGLCVGALNFLRGFSHQHRLTLQPQRYPVAPSDKTQARPTRLHVTTATL